MLPENLLRRLENAPRLTVLTGAGVSAASGVPTFRSADGLWRNFRPEELATADAFRRDPVMVWEWYAWRRHRIAACEPNPAHHVIARWSQREGCRVITQNVDDLHLRAGTRNVIRLHGSIWEMKCWNQCGKRPWREMHTAPVTQDNLPCCPSCAGLARPAVVWFGESLDPADLTAALDACACDVFLTIGTSAVVHPAAGFVEAAKRHGAFTVEINPAETAASHAVDLCIRETAETVLPRLILH